MTLGLELRDTKVYEPGTRALLGTASHFCEAVVLESRTVPSGTALGSRSGALRWRTHVAAVASYFSSLLLSSLVLSDSTIFEP